MTWQGIQLWRVAVAAIAYFMIGGLWYSPMLFARPWMVAMGYDPNDKQKLDEMRKGAGKLYAIAFLTSLISALVLAKLMLAVGVAEPMRSLKVAFGVWLGFVATVQLTGTLFGRRNPKVFFIDTGFQLVSYLAMGVILTAGM